MTALMSDDECMASLTWGVTCMGKSHGSESGGPSVARSVLCERPLAARTYSLVHTLIGEVTPPRNGVRPSVCVSVPTSPIRNVGWIFGMMSGQGP